jgi:hypothetical protein
MKAPSEAPSVIRDALGLLAPGARPGGAGVRLLPGDEALRVHLLYKLGLSKRAIAAQCGWSEKAVENLLRVYGHIDLIALGEVDRLYENVPLQPAAL